MNLCVLRYRTILREELGVQHFLRSIRTFYWEKEEKGSMATHPLYHPTTKVKTLYVLFFSLNFFFS